MKNLLRRAAAGNIFFLLFLTAAVLVAYGRVLLRPDLTFPWDFRAFHYPLMVGVADSLARGEFPLWDPYVYCGRPLASNPQSAIFYPPTWFVVAFGRSGLLERMEWLAVGHVGLAAIFTYFLALKLGRGKLRLCSPQWCSVLAHFLCRRSNTLGLIGGLPWFVGALRALLIPERRGRIGLLSFCWVMTLLSGFIAFSIMTVLATVVFTALVKRESRLAIDLALAGLLTTAMAAVLLGPASALVAQSIGKYRTDWMGFGGGVPPESVATFFQPNYFGGFDPATFSGRGDLTQMYLFCGWSTLLLAGLGVRRAIPVAGFALTCLVLAFGEFTPVGRLLFSLLPEAVQRATYWYVFLAPALLGVALLASAGLQRFSRWALGAAIFVACELTLVSS
jgi:hypothetical protein